MISVIWSVWLLWMSVWDCLCCHVPKRLLWGGGAGGLVFYVIGLLGETEVPGVRELLFTWIPGMLPGICLLVVHYITGAVGTGDGWVMVLLGIVTGVRRAVLLLTAALFLTAITSVVLLFLRKVRRDSGLPFIPFLTVGWFLVGIAGGGI